MFCFSGSSSVSFFSGILCPIICVQNDLSLNFSLLSLRHYLLWLQLLYTDGNAQCSIYNTQLQSLLWPTGSHSWPLAWYFLEPQTVLLETKPQHIQNQTLSPHKAVSLPIFPTSINGSHPWSFLNCQVIPFWNIFFICPSHFPSSILNSCDSL